MPSTATLAEIIQVVSQGGFVVVSIALAWAVMRLWEDNKNLQKENSEIFKQVIADNKTDMEQQVALTREIVESLGEMRKSIDQLKSARSLPPGDGK